MTTETPAKDTDHENEALAQLRMGDPTTCTAIVERCGPSVYNYLYWLTGNAEEAETLFKDAVLNLYLNPSRGRKERSLYDWFYRHTTQAWLHNRHRQQQRRSSLDYILRGGLKETAMAPWADWLTQCPVTSGNDAEALEPIVDGLSQLSDHERTTLLLTTVAHRSIRIIANTLRIRPRKVRKRLSTGFAQLAAGPNDPTDRPTRALTHLAQRRVLGLEKSGQARKLDGLLTDNEAGKSVLAHNESLHQALQHLPEATPPEDLVDATIVHLKEGHAALETRIATWGFRFMQVTVPLFILAILAIILLPAISRSRDMARRAAAADNLTAIGKALRAYSEASYGNRFPPLTATNDLWVPDIKTIFPRYIADPAQLVSPSLNDPNLVAAMTSALTQSPPDWEQAQKLFSQSYVYMGYTLLDAQAFASFLAVRKSETGIDLEGDVETDNRRFFRLRKGVEQFFAGDPTLSRPDGSIPIPVMFEVYTTTGFGANPEGANVLYLDGTVTFVPFGSAFPVDAAVMDILDDQYRNR
tara:strand:+ start:345 stop:1925 length:1581 start_codon:yes stop_codon:yes gene_type:complete